MSNVVESSSGRAQPAAYPPISPRRIGAIARLRVRAVTRSRLALAAVVLAVLPWALVDDGTLYLRVTWLTQSSIIALTVLGAGVLADDMAGGQYAIALTHGTSPIEVLTGDAVATALLIAGIVAVQLPIALAGTLIVHLLPLLLCIAWMIALLAGWLAFMLFAATFVERKGNAVAMVPLILFLPLALHSDAIDRLPALAAAAVRFVLQLLPSSEHATAMYRVLLRGDTASAMPAVVLVLAPPVYFALASLRLHRMEPAGRLAQ